jgi:hypothetical protein
MVLKAHHTVVSTLVSASAGWIAAAPLSTHGVIPAALRCDGPVTKLSSNSRAAMPFLSLASLLFVPVTKRQQAILIEMYQQRLCSRRTLAGRHVDRGSHLQERQMSFFLHLWLEGDDSSAWRGRVNDGMGGPSKAFEDEQTLLNFIRERLLSEYVVLPKRRGEA